MLFMIRVIDELNNIESIITQHQILTILTRIVMVQFGISYRNLLLIMVGTLM